MMKNKALIVFSGLLLLAGCAQMGQLALKLMTSKEKDLTKMATVGLYQSNLYSFDIKTMTTDQLKESHEGQSMVGVQFIKTEGYGFLDLDGTVLINGDTIKTATGGVYYTYLDKANRKPVKIDIHSVSGQKTSFEIAPAASFSIKSINGKTSDFVVDLTKDLVLEFDLPAAAKGKLMAVGMISKMPGGQEFNDFQTFHAASKVTIPAGSFKSTRITGGDLVGKSVIGFLKENQYLKVELIEESRAKLEPVPYFRKRSSYLDTRPVKVVGETQGYAYFKASGKVEVKDEKPFMFEGTAATGFYGASLEAKKLRIGIASLGVYANLFKQSTSKSSTTVGDIEYTKTTITTYQFPQLDDKYWDEYLSGVYADFKKLLQSYDVEVVDIDKVMADKNYSLFHDVENKNTKEIFSKNYKGAKRLSIAGISEIGEQTATAGITDDLPKPKLLSSLNVDAIVTLSLNFAVAGDANKVVLYPSANILIEGFTLPDKSSVSNWYDGGGRRGKGVPFSKEDFKNTAALNRILQKDMVMKGIKALLDDLIVKQREAQVAESWNLMKK